MKLNLEAVGAGICAALASVFAKFAVASHQLPALCNGLVRLMLSATEDNSNEDSSSSVYHEFCSSVTLFDQYYVSFFMFLITHSVPGSSCESKL